MSKEKITAITLEEEGVLSSIYSLFELVKAEESRLLFIRETELAKYNTQAKQLIIGGIIILMAVVIFFRGISFQPDLRHKAIRRHRKVADLALLFGDAQQIRSLGA